MTNIKNSADYGGISDDLRRIFEIARQYRLPDVGLLTTLNRLADEKSEFQAWVRDWNRATPEAKASWTTLWHRIRKQAKAGAAARGPRS
jgi:hypothetical protein